MKKIYITIIVLAVAAIGVLYVKSQRGDIEVPSLDASYLQTRIDGDLYAAKEQKLSRFFVDNGIVKQEPVAATYPPGGSGFYEYIGSYSNLLATAYDGAPAIEIFASSHANGPKSVYSRKLAENMCEFCAGLESAQIKNGIFLYSYMTSERQSPIFYYAIDLTKEPLEDKQISKEEWDKLLAG